MSNIQERDLAATPMSFNEFTVNVNRTDQEFYVVAGVSVRTCQLKTLSPEGMSYSYKAFGVIPVVRYVRAEDFGKKFKPFSRRQDAERYRLNNQL